MRIRLYVIRHYKYVICAKRKHYVKSIEENMRNPKLMWKHLNCLLNRMSKRTGAGCIKK